MMTKKRAVEIGLNVYERIRKPYYQGVAAQLAFFFLMSMVPTFLLLGQLLGIFSISTDLLHELLGQYMTADILDTLGEYLRYQPSGAFNLLMVVCVLWAASKSQFALIGVANYTYTGQTRGRGYLRERFRAIVNVLLTLLLLVFSLVVLVYGNLILVTIDNYLLGFLKWEEGLSRLWYLLRWPIGVAAYLFAITYILYTLPSKRLPFKKILPGSLLASAGMILVTLGYSAYTNFSTGNSYLYGSLASIVVLLVWFYFISYVLVIGIIFNAAWNETEQTEEKSH